MNCELASASTCGLHLATYKTHSYPSSERK